MKEHEALELFDEHIDELHEYVTICGYHYTVSKAFIGFCLSVFVLVQLH